jgi:hypothetical protein
MERLTAWRLASPHDLRRARRLVRQLACDLPAFDTVWIDALVQLGRLTPYQARLLESDDPAQLLVGDLLLLDEFGHSAWSRTWLARPVNGPATVRCVVKRLTPPRELQAAAAERWRQLLAVSRGFAHPCLVAADRGWEDAQGLWIVSRHVDGVALPELLVRRGPVGYER